MTRRRMLALTVLGGLPVSVGSGSADGPEWERYFRIDWTTNTGPTGTVVHGYVESRPGVALALVRVAVEALAPDSRVFRSAFSSLELAPSSGEHFRTTMPFAANYHVRIVSFVLATRPHDMWHDL